MPDEAMVIVLAGGASERLHPLTQERSQSAIYFDGTTRIIDFDLNN